MKWIKVQDGMPDNDEEVIVWVIYEDGTETFTDSEFDAAECRWLMGSAKNFRVTHWMRIKAPR